jgi:hypothetical protein
VRKIEIGVRIYDTIVRKDAKKLRGDSIQVRSGEIKVRKGEI